MEQGQPGAKHCTFILQAEFEDVQGKCNEFEFPLNDKEEDVSVEEVLECCFSVSNDEGFLRVVDVTDGQRKKIVKRSPAGEFRFKCGSRYIVTRQSEGTKRVETDTKRLAVLAKSLTERLDRIIVADNSFEISDANISELVFANGVTWSVQDGMLHATLGGAQKLLSFGRENIECATVSAPLGVVAKEVLSESNARVGDHVQFSANEVKVGNNVKISVGGVEVNNVSITAGKISFNAVAMQNGQNNNNNNEVKTQLSSQNLTFPNFQISPDTIKIPSQVFVQDVVASQEVLVRGAARIDANGNLETLSQNAHILAVGHIWYNVEKKT